MYTVHHIKRPFMTIAQGYIGITGNFTKRIRQHILNSINGNHNNGYLMRAIKKHKDMEYVILHSNLSEQDALACEAFYRPVPSMGWNIKAGGLDGCIMSSETKNKISSKRKGYIPSEATKQKLREYNLGKKQSKETIEKRSKVLSELFKGRPKTSTKEIESLVKGRKGAGNPMVKLANIYCALTHNLIAENVALTTWCQGTEYSAKQLRRTANLNEPLKVHKQIYAKYIKDII